MFESRSVDILFSAAIIRVGFGLLDSIFLFSSKYHVGHLAPHATHGSRSLANEIVFSSYEIQDSLRPSPIF